MKKLVPFISSNLHSIKLQFEILIWFYESYIINWICIYCLLEKNKSPSTFSSSSSPLDSMPDSSAFPFQANQETSSNDMFSQSSSTALNTNNTQTTSYFLNHALCELSMQSPFYFAIKLNNLRMCQLFLDGLKKTYLTSLNAKLIKRHQMQLHISKKKFFFTVYLKNFLSLI